MRYLTLRFIGGDVYRVWTEIPAPRLTPEQVWQFGQPGPDTTTYEPLRGFFDFGYEIYDEADELPDLERARRIEKVRALAERGATPGERAAARAALERLGAA